MDAIQPTVDKDMYPLLHECIQYGWIYFDGPEVVGIAADDIHVHLGRPDDLDSVEEYLEDNATPDMW